MIFFKLMNIEYIDDVTFTEAIMINLVNELFLALKDGVWGWRGFDDSMQSLVIHTIFSQCRGNISSVSSNNSEVLAPSSACSNLHHTKCDPRHGMVKDVTTHSHTLIEVIRRLNGALLPAIHLLKS